MKFIKLFVILTIANITLARPCDVSLDSLIKYAVVSDTAELILHHEGIHYFRTLSDQKVMSVRTLYRKLPGQVFILRGHLSQHSIKTKTLIGFIDNDSITFLRSTNRCQLRFNKTLGNEIPNATALGGIRYPKNRIPFINRLDRLSESELNSHMLKLEMNLRKRFSFSSSGKLHFNDSIQVKIDSTQEIIRFTIVSQIKAFNFDDQIVPSTLKALGYNINHVFNNSSNSTLDDDIRQQKTYLYSNQHYRLIRLSESQYADGSIYLLELFE